MEQLKINPNGQWQLLSKGKPSYTFSDAGSGKSHHEYNVHKDGKKVGNYTIQHGGGGSGSLHGKHPDTHEEEHAALTEAAHAHHNKLKRPYSL